MTFVARIVILHVVLVEGAAGHQHGQSVEGVQVMQFPASAYVVVRIDVAAAGTEVGALRLLHTSQSSHLLGLEVVV